MQVRVFRRIVPADFNLPLDGIPIVVLLAVLHREAGINSRLPDREQGTDWFLVSAPALNTASSRQNQSYSCFYDMGG